ncbi:hypothetical protein GCM10022247_35350 [Allokutzneria multivorans]|uniref:DUF4956 domain-containing protein n=2 Tax=Allokutzneria multivorans TaxID=1142134 RepID=A0ABP7SCW6_9PSEU
MFAFVAALAYALGYTAQDAFYFEFGLSLEQVGIDKVAALFRLTPLAFIVAIAACLFVAITVALVELLLRRRGARLFRHVPAVVLTPAILGIAGLLAQLSSIPFVRGVGVAIFVWGVGTVVWFIFDALIGRLVAIIAAGVTVVACAGIALLLWVSVTAVEIRDRGFPLAEPVMLRMVGIRVAMVDLRWKDPARRPPALAQPAGASPGQQRLLLVLNESGGRFTVYDCVSKQVFRISDSDADMDRYLGPLYGDRRTEPEWAPRLPPCLVRDS